MRRAVTLVLTWIVLVPGLAAAQQVDLGGNFGGGGSVDAAASTAGSSAGFVVTATLIEESWAASTNPCSYDVVSLEQALQTASSFLGLDPPAVPPQSPGTDSPPWLVVWCPDPVNTLQLVGAFPLATAPPPADVMVSVARGQLSLPLPVPELSPPQSTFQITGVESWLWLPSTSVQPIVATGCTGPLDYACATITATYDHLVVDPGDGSGPFGCEGTTAYDLDRLWIEQSQVPHCGHTYTNASGPPGYRVDVTAAWSLEWTCTWDQDFDGVRESSCGGGPLPIAGRSSDPIALDVRDLQARATR